MTPPTPDEVRAWRRARDLSARAAGALVHVTPRAWQMWESGDRAMHPAFWALVQLRHGDPPTAP